MHCEKMAVTYMSFRRRAVIEFLVKEGRRKLVSLFRSRDQTTKFGMASRHIAQKEEAGSSALGR
jgi:hypothetical protein